MSNLADQITQSNLGELITREYGLEHKANLKAVNPGDIPISFEAITSEWLTHILCKGHPEARVIDHRLDAFDDGMTNRCRIFLTYNAAGIAAGLPTSVFCKAAQQLANRLLLANVGLTQVEVAFYNKYRALLDIEAPVCLLAAYSPRSYSSMLMFDDLLRHGVEFCQHTTGITRERVEDQLAALAKLHGRFYESPELNAPDMLTYEEFFHITNKWFDMENCCNIGFQAAEAVIPARLFKRSAEFWPATLKSTALHGTLPRTFTHNDVHLKNWYIRSDGRMGLSDWQWFGAGHWGRDFAYAVSTCLTIENRRAWEQELLEFYLDRLRAAGGPAVAFADAWTYYRQHLLSPLQIWTLGLAPFSEQTDGPAPDSHPREVMLEYIKRMATAIDDLDSMSSFD